MVSNLTQTVFENMRAITASLHKSECSTYSKYASASLLLNSLYLPRLFSKRLAKGRASSAPHGKKVSSPYQNCQGWQWFQVESSSHCELADQEWTRMYILGRACGTFLPDSLNLLRLFSKRLILYNRKDAKSAKDFFNFL